MAATAWNVVGGAASKELLAADEHRNELTVQLQEQAVPGADPVYLGFGEDAVTGTGLALGGIGHTTRIRGPKARRAVNALSAANSVGGIETHTHLEYRHVPSYPAYWDKPGQGPAVVHYDPPDDAPGVSAFTDLIIMFDRNVVVVEGKNAVIYLTDDTLVETIPVGARFSASGGIVTIDPVNPLTPDNGYYVQIDNGAITDVPGVAWAGISDETTWNFTVPLL